MNIPNFCTPLDQLGNEARLRIIAAAFQQFPSGHDIYGIYAEWKHQLDKALECFSPSTPPPEAAPLTPFGEALDLLETCQHNDPDTRYEDAIGFYKDPKNPSDVRLRDVVKAFLERHPPQGRASMNKTEWAEYWQKRTVKAEMALTTIHTLAEVNGYERVEQIIESYFASVAAGEVKDTPLSPAAHDEQGSKK